jgi:putative membrane protein (TIGR04086 family)
MTGTLRRMTRAQILALSVVACVFGVLSLRGPDSAQSVSRAINVVLAVALIFIAGRDLKQRGWQYGYLIGLTYILPLIGLLTYLSLSDRPKVDAAAV